MVKVEPYEGNLVRSYSDAGYWITNTAGEMYTEAIDPSELGRTYTETEILIEADAEASLEDYEDALREVGVL